MIGAKLRGKFHLSSVQFVMRIKFWPFGAAFRPAATAVGDSRAPFILGTVGRTGACVLAGFSEERARFSPTLSATGMCNSKLGHFACQTPPESVHRLLFQPSKTSAVRRLCAANCPLIAKQTEPAQAFVLQYWLEGFIFWSVCLLDVVPN